MSYTGTCPACYKKFSDCECKWATVATNSKTYSAPEPTEKFKLEDLLHTTTQHCKIAQILLKENRQDLLPSVLEDIFYFVQYLPGFFIGE